MMVMITQKRKNQHWVNFVQSNHLAVKTSLVFHKTLHETFIQKKLLTPSVKLGITFQQVVTQIYR